MASRVTLTAVDAKLDMLVEEFRRLEACINGNGSPGLRSEIATLKERHDNAEKVIKDMIEERKEREREARGLRNTVVAALITQFAMLVFTMLTK